MKNSTRFVIIIGLLVMSWWLQNLLDTKPELITREKTRFANYFLDDFSLLSHDDNGAIKYTLKAQRLDNYDEENIAELKQVSVEFKGPQRNWTLTSGEATINHQTKQIVFFKHVKLERPETDSQLALRIETDSMTLDNKTDILQTQSTVRLISDKARLQSQGMRFDNRNNTLELLAKVRGQYEK